jgi:hypothetical protein
VTGFYQKFLVVQGTGVTGFYELFYEANVGLRRRQKQKLVPLPMIGIGTAGLLPYSLQEYVRSYNQVHAGLANKRTPVMLTVVHSHLSRVVTWQYTILQYYYVIILFVNCIVSTIMDI